jgi:ribosomal protein L30E
LKKFIPNYWINLISPADMEDEEFDKFRTHLGLAMKVIKHQSEDADAIIMAANHRKIDRETAIFLNKVANLKLVYEEKSGGVDMCKALERRYQEKEVAGAIKMLKSDGVSDEDIIIKVTKLFGVTKEYVLTLLRAQVA